MDHDLITALYSKINALEKKMCCVENENMKLRSRIDNLETVNKIMLENKCITFDIRYFLNNQSVEYLKLFNLTRDDISKICGSISNINFPCTKYLIDLHSDKVRALNTSDRYDKHIMQFCTQFFTLIFMRSNQDCIVYLLDVCVEKGFINILMHQNANRSQSIHHIIFSGQSKPKAIIRILDIYDKYNLDLESSTCQRDTPLSMICTWGSLESIKYAIDLFVRKGMFLGNCKTNEKLENILLRERRIDRIVLIMYLKSIEYMEFSGV